MARYDFGLLDRFVSTAVWWKPWTWFTGDYENEFWELTPGMFWALGKRRNVKIKYERYAHGLTASMIYNANRGEDAPAIMPFDFIRDAESARKKEALSKARRFCSRSISTMPMGTPMEKLQSVRLKAIADLKASGHNDAEEIFDSMWPHLKPKEKMQ